MSLKRSASSRFLLPLLILLPVFLHVLLLITFSQDIPWVDDYFWYFGFLKRADEAASLPAFWQTILAPYNNHWHVVQRLAIVGVTNLTGQIPMVAFSWLGNLLFAMLFFFFVSEGRNKGTKLTAGAVAASWLFFQPVSHYNFFECAFFNLPVLLFSFLAIRGFSNGGRWWSVWAILATFSNGNGILVWPVIILMALRNRNRREALRYGFIFAGFAALYLFLSRDTGDGPGRLSLTPMTELLLYFIQLVGSIDIQEIRTPYWWAVRTGFGLVIMLVFLWLGVSMNRKEQTRWFFCLFILMTMGVVTLTRREVNHFSAEVLAHYWMFPQLFLAGLLCVLIDRREMPKMAKVALVSVAVILSLSNYGVKLPLLNGHYAVKAANLMNYQAQEKLRLHPPIQGLAEYTKVNELMNFAVTSSFYVPPVAETAYLTTDCAVRANADGSVSVSASLPWRMLFRLVILEVTDKDGMSTYLPADPPFSAFGEWVKRKKNRRADISWAVQALSEPLPAEEITGCRLLRVK